MDGILNMAFLQAACAHKAEEPEQPVVINLKALQADPTVTKVTSTGEITITVINSGTVDVQTSAALTEAALAITADDQAAITLSALGLVINELGSQVELVTE